MLFGKAVFLAFMINGKSVKHRSSGLKAHNIKGLRVSQRL